MSTISISEMGLLLFSLLIVVGLLLAYGGHPLYTFAIFAIGAVFSAGAYYLSTSAGGAASPDTFGLLATGFVGGLVFLFVQFLAILAAGFLIGWFLVIATGTPSDAVQLLGGLLGAGASLLLHGVIIIVSTAGLGAFILSKAIVAGPAADLRLLLVAERSSLVFWFVFVAGGLTQFGAVAAGHSDA